MKLQKLSIIVLTLCIIFMSLLFSYHFLLNEKMVNSSNPKSNAAKQSSKDKSVPIPTGAGNQNNPATWTRYTYNSEFSITYPPYWNVILDQDGNGVSFMTTGFHQDDDFSMPYGNSNEVVYTIFGQNDISDMKLKDGDEFPSDATSETMVITHLKHLQIAGFPAVEFDYYPTDNTNFLRTRIVILKGNKVYQFNATYAQDAGKQIIEEMMQSLKFI